ncbi:MAG: hypothetical protein JJE09_04125 [Bacteroidia bacterium]|nr:hypothetical protein [Bacteroidia bacterium]
MARHVLLFVLVGLTNSLVAQVKNNAIRNRIALDINADPTHSSTAQSDVEWGCINKALTNKCLVYHNDQWFNFSVPIEGTYFINLSNQNCRDLQGLQVILIEGNPCETKSYKIHSCLPKIRQEDVFIQIDSLKPSIQYLVNIDGFLDDQCSFGIQISDKPTGLPLRDSNLTYDTIPVIATLKGKIVNLSWSVTEEKIAMLESFKLYRGIHNAIKQDFIREIGATSNSYGAPVLYYSASDSLVKEGTYIYRIYGIQKQTQMPYLLVNRVVKYHEPKPKQQLQRSIKLNLKLADKTPFQVLVYDEATNTLLKKYKKEFDVTFDQQHEVDLGEFIDRGLRNFMILVADGNSRDALTLYYTFDLKGNLIQR